MIVISRLGGRGAALAISKNPETRGKNSWLSFAPSCNAQCAGSSHKMPLGCEHLVVKSLLQLYRRGVDVPDVNYLAVPRTMWPGLWRGGDKLTAGYAVTRLPLRLTRIKARLMPPSATGDLACPRLRRPATPCRVATPLWVCGALVVARLCRRRANPRLACYCMVALRAWRHSICSDQRNQIFTESKSCCRYFIIKDRF